MNDLHTLNPENLVIDTDSKSKRYSHEEKIKHLEDAIKNGGYYGDDGQWNSIQVFSGDNHIYRVRVETLIIKDNDYIFIKFLPKDQTRNNKRTYLIPGGSIEKDVTNMDQAINECREEARINIKNIKSTGITYKEIKDPPKWAIASQAVNWNGNITEIYVADYESDYKGHIDKEVEDKYVATGKFYQLEKVYPFLKSEHKRALDIIYPDRFKNIKKPKAKLVKESSKINKAKLLDDVIKFLEDKGYHPIVSKRTRDAFLHDKKFFISDGRTCLISGFKQNEVCKVSSLLNTEFKTDDIEFTPDNYGTIFLSVGSDVIAEKALTTEERNQLDSNQFGIPSLRKFPIHDRAHVIQAIRFFNEVDKKHEKELAYNIIKAMRYYKIDFSIVGERNRLITYINREDD